MPDQPPFDWVIRGGTLITPGGLLQADLGIRGDKIAAAGSGLTGRQVVDASGQYVLPGGVDPHVHLETQVGATYSSDDWQTGSLAAAYGGTTTILDFVEPLPGQPLLEAFNERVRQAQGRTAVDFSLHMTLTSASPGLLSELEGLAQAGCTSWKVYTTYAGFALDDASILEILAAASRQQALVMVHAESDAILAFARQQLREGGMTGPSAHPRSRPPQAESEAVQSILALAETTAAPVYIVHLSTAHGAQALAAARQQGTRAFGETCPQYLLLDEGVYNRSGFEGAKYVCAPPLRTRRDQERLWQALAEGTIQAVGTDHCPFFYHGQKDLGLEDYTLIPGGLPGIESRLSLLHTFGVVEGRLSLARWVEVCSTEPARLFGLYPRKGCLEPGSDADIVIFDPRLTRRITVSGLHQNVDYTPYEGFIQQGAPVGVFLRGSPLLLPGQDLAPAARGEYVPCKVSSAYSEDTSPIPVNRPLRVEESL